MKSDLATRFVGFCPVCEGTFKLLKGKLVHHGYERPGDGYIHGDCFSVKKEPHETSPKVAQDFKAACEGRLVDAQAYLARLQNGEVKSFTRLNYNQTKQTTITADRIVTKVLATGEETVKTGIVAEYEFEQATKNAIRETEWRIKGIEAHIARMEGHLKDWAPKPLVTWEESVAACKAAKDAAKGTKTDARQKRIDSKIASYQKRIDSALGRFKKGTAASQATLADIFESTTHAWHALGFKSHSEFLGVIDRNAVWTEFGLLLDAPYRSEAYTKNSDTLHDMRSARYV